MKRFAPFLLFFVSLGVHSTFGQSTCSCSDYDCRVSQSCPSGHLASCSCTATGCSGKCIKEGAELPEISFETGGQGLFDTLMGSDEKAISGEFSRNLGREVVFTKAPGVQTLDVGAPSFKSYWEIAEFLAGKGKLTIGGLPFEIWKGKRETLLKGGGYSICANDLPAQMILDEINFLTERNFKIVSGDPKSKANALINGNSLVEVLGSLSRSRNIKISTTERVGNQAEIARKFVGVN